MVEKLIFDHTLEGLFLRGLAGQVTPRLKEKLRGVGVDLEQKLQAAYPFSTWVRSIGLAAEELYPALPEPDAWRLLGERMVEGYQETVMGGAMISLLKALGPQRMLGRAQKNFRSGNNYTETRLTQVAPTVVELWMNETGRMRYFIQGMLLAGMRAGGAPGATVDIAAWDEQGTTYLIAWPEARDRAAS